MSSPTHENSKIIVRLARNKDEIEASQRLRYKVFYEEYAAIPTEEMISAKRDINAFDDITDHLIVIDKSIQNEDDQIVGTYRLLRQEIAEAHGKFYTSDEYNIDALVTSGTKLLELGRSCVLPEYRTRPVIQKLWEGIAGYIAQHNIGLMFGCASIPGTDVDSISKSLAYLYHYHLAPENIRPVTLPEHYVSMALHEKENISKKEAIASLPPLIKGYLRLGAVIGDGAFIDRQWNSIDVCIVMPTHFMQSKYLHHYQRRLNDGIVIDDAFSQNVPVSARSTG